MKNKNKRYKGEPLSKWYERRKKEAYIMACFEDFIARIKYKEHDKRYDKRRKEIIKNYNKELKEIDKIYREYAKKQKNDEKKRKKRALRKSK